MSQSVEVERALSQHHIHKLWVISTPKNDNVSAMTIYVDLTYTVSFSKVIDMPLEPTPMSQVDNI